MEKAVEISSKYAMKGLFDVATLLRGVTYDKSDQRLTETSNVVLTADNITLDRRFEVTKRIFIDESKSFSDECRLKADDIFICMSSGSKKHVGKVAYIPLDTNYYAGGFMGILRTASADCIPKYLYYVLNAPIVKNIRFYGVHRIDRNIQQYYDEEKARCGGNRECVSMRWMYIMWPIR